MVFVVVVNGDLGGDMENDMHQCSTMHGRKKKSRTGAEFEAVVVVWRSGGEGEGEGEGKGGLVEVEAEERKEKGKGKGKEAGQRKLHTDCGEGHVRLSGVIVMILFMLNRSLCKDNRYVKYVHII